MEIVNVLFSPTSGPLWGFAGVVLTQALNMYVGRRNNLASVSTGALEQVNVAHKQLVEGLFQQVKVLNEQVENLRGHTEECERQHREKDRQLNEALVRLSQLEQAAGLAD